jgi:hypothetical protein
MKAPVGAWIDRRARMQIDFHHTVTYVVARLAGFAHEDASTVAYASQYVDDSTNKGTIQFDNGKTFDRIASAHTVLDVPHNRINDEDYQVWVPFHFLPGNKWGARQRNAIRPFISALGLYSG